MFIKYKSMYKEFSNMRKQALSRMVFLKCKRFLFTHIMTYDIHSREKAPQAHLVSHKPRRKK